MNVFGIGLPEMILILVLALLIFGPKKLPEIGSSLGKALRGFQDATKDFENEFKREAKQIEEKIEPTPVNLPDKTPSTVAQEKVAQEKTIDSSSDG
ncbi:MAG: TatA/E family twin arginine-targeting protein translocase [Geitlerinemataceae cyanobacterium]